MFKKLCKEISTLKEMAQGTTTLTHTTIRFITIDGEEHYFHCMNYADPSTIRCSVLEFFLIGKDMLEDDDGKFYPMHNIISIEGIIDDKIENVVVKSMGHWPDTYYPQKNIKIADWA